MDIAAFSCVDHCTQVTVNCYKDASQRVLAILTASCQLQTSILCLDSLLNCYSISSLVILCSIPKKLSKVPLFLLFFFFSVHHAEPFSKMHLAVVDGFCTSFLVFLLHRSRNFPLSFLSAKLFSTISFSHRVSSSFLFLF